ncbi:ABC transporter permease, partial [Paraburkholderia sp. 5N]|nr:ABC transporter permease [Paraburkholderia elongata]
MTMINRTEWFAVRRELSLRGKWILGVGSFLLPLAVWCVLSYVPFVWHPQVLVTSPGSVDYFQSGMR